MEDQFRLILWRRGVCLVSHYQQSPAIDSSIYITYGDPRKESLGG